MSRRTLLPILLIMLALVGWGAFLAVGAFLYNEDVRKLLIVAACVAAFILFWALMLAIRIRGRGGARRKSVPHQGEKPQAEKD